MRSRPAAMIVSVTSLGLLCAACTAQESSDAAESFFVSFMEFMLVMMLIAAAFVLIWAIIFAGAATLLFAGLRRLFGDRPAPPPPPPAGPLPDAEQAAAPQRQQDAPRNRDPDPFAIGMIVLGVVLLISAAPVVFSANSGFTSPGQVTLPLPLIIAGVGLLVYALRRKR